MSDFKWNEKIEYRFYNSYIGKEDVREGTAKEILADPTVLPQAKMQVLSAVVLELIERVEQEELIKEFDKMTSEGISL